MNYLLRITFLPFLVLYLSACATPRGYVERDFILPPNAKTGIIVGSVSQDIPTGLAYTISSFRIETGDEKEYAVVNALDTMFFGMAAGNDLENAGVQGQVFAVEFPVGTHKVTSWGIIVGNTHYSPKDIMQPLTFTVKRGEATYIGNLHMVLGKGKNLLGMATPYPKFPMVSNHYDRDMPLVKIKYQNLAALRMNIDIPHNGPWTLSKKPEPNSAER